MQPAHSGIDEGLLQDLDNIPCVITHQYVFTQHAMHDLIQNNLAPRAGNIKNICVVDKCVIYNTTASEISYAYTPASNDNTEPRYNQDKSYVFMQRATYIMIHNYLTPRVSCTMITFVAAPRITNVKSISFQFCNPTYLM